MPEVKTFIELNQKLKPLTGRNETAKRLKEIVGYLPSEKAGFVQFTHKLRKYVNGLNPEG